MVELLADLECNSEPVLNERTLLGFANNIPSWDSWGLQYASLEQSNVTIQFIDSTNGRVEVLSQDILFGASNSILTAAERVTYPDAVALPFVVSKTASLPGRMCYSDVPFI